MIDKNSSPGSRSVVGIEWKSSGSWESEWTKKDGDRSFLVLFFIVIRYTMSFVLMGNSKLNVRPGSRHSKYNICFYVLMVCSFVFMIVGLVFSRVLKLYAKCSAESALEIQIYAFASGCLLVRAPRSLVQSPIAYWSDFDKGWSFGIESPSSTLNRTHDHAFTLPRLPLVFLIARALTLARTKPNFANFSPYFSPHFSPYLACFIALLAFARASKSLALLNEWKVPGARLWFAIAGMVDVLMLLRAVGLEGRWGSRSTTRESDWEGTKPDVRLGLDSILAASTGVGAMGSVGLLTVAS